MPIATSAAIALGAGALASGAAGLAGHLENMSAQDRAALLQDKGVQAWLAVNVPDPEEQKLALKQFVQVGKLTPVLETGLKAAEPDIIKFAQDPKLKESRLRALSSLEQQGYGGEQVQDTAAREQAQIEAGAQNRGEQEAIVGSLARRGQLGSGLELQARMAASQGNQDQLAKNALDIEAARRTRALQAVQGAGSLAGDISNQDFSQASAKSDAKSAIDKFNTSNLQAVGARNADRTADVNASNLGQAQKTADLNTTTSNYEQEYNKELAQQKFQNDAAKAAGVSGQYGAQAATALDNGKSAANMWAGIGNGLASAATGAATLAAKKKTVNDDELYSDDE